MKLGKISMRRVLMLALGLGGLMACHQSEVPRPGTVCFPQYGTNDPVCAPQMCTKDVQTISKDTTAENFTCERCGNLPDYLLTPPNVTGWANVTYESSNLNLVLSFDNRLTLDFSEANFRKYMGSAVIEYESPQGTSRMYGVPFEVLGYDGKKLHVHIESRMYGLSFETSGTPRLCRIGGVMVPCTTAECVYGADTGSPAALMDAAFFELTVDLNLPLTITPF